MPKKYRHAVLSELSTFDKQGATRVVVETPRGSCNKYDYKPIATASN